MKCIVKYMKITSCLLALSISLSGCGSSGISIAGYESGDYIKTPYKAEGYAASLCVAENDVKKETVELDSGLHAAGFFDITKGTVLYSSNLHKKLYPASTTKILTAYLALKYGNRTDTITISKNATVFPAGASLAHLKEGDQITLEELLYGLLLPSGNDAAVAIAEYISGSVEEFANLMNSEAYSLGATNSHFVNPHGLHDDNHYTTAYDLYLIFNECLKQEQFVKVITEKTHTGVLKSKDGTTRKEEWKNTSLYMTGEAELPTTVEYLGGKTGNTDEAKRCLIAYSKDKNNNDYYISIVMGANGKPLLYQNMNEMLNHGVETK